jgi:hypothetical protein
MTKYNLVNPYMDGNLNTSIKASSELKAAGKIYEQVLSPIFITSAPEFNFTIEGGGKLYHFTVKESVKGDDAKFKIEKFNGTVDDAKFKTKLSEIQEQSGGKHKHKRKDDDSSSSSSSDSPSYYSINRYCYSPYIYTPYINSGSSIYYTIPIISPTYITPTTYYSIGYPVLI